MIIIIILIILLISGTIILNIILIIGLPPGPASRNQKGWPDRPWDGSIPGSGTPFSRDEVSKYITSRDRINSGIFTIPGLYNPAMAGRRG
jgi:hypothetical protein